MEPVPGDRPRPADPASLTRDRQFIVACVREALGLGRMSSEVPLDNAPLDWQHTLKLVFRHGLAPLVHVGLPVSGMQVPTTVRALLKTGYLGATVRTETWLEPNLRRILQTLVSLDIDPIVVKGAALAYLAYPKPIYRTLNDVDLLLPPDHLARASDALHELGLWTNSAETDPVHHLRTHYAGDGHVGIELHHRLLKSPHPYQVDSDDLRARSQRATIAGVAVNTLSATDALHFNCVHLAYSHRYNWFPLRSLVDVLVLATNRGDDLDWDLLVKTVREAQTSGAVFWPLWLSRRWLNAPIPVSVLTSLAPPSGIYKAIAGVMDSPFLLENRSVGGNDALDWMLLELSLYAGCSWQEQLRAIFRSLFPAPRGVGHLPADVTTSRLRYSAYLARPARAVHGLVSLGHLIGRVFLKSSPSYDGPVPDPRAQQTFEREPALTGGLALDHKEGRR